MLTMQTLLHTHHFVLLHIAYYLLIVSLRCHIPFIILMIYHLASYNLDVPEKPLEGGALEDPDEMPKPPQLSPFDVTS